ncbi:MAG: methyltransferase domain-containing protein [Acidobacteria bacterium]|nr:methyltransferase domain-containing protein [Acidobacteriota bacterium]
MPPHRVQCPLCCSRLRGFRNFGQPPRPGALCPRCGAVERHRFLWLYLQRLPQDAASIDLLHFAPEPCLSGRLAALHGDRYHSVDLGSIAAQSRQDITRLALRDAVFDRIICSHVLEHVPDDQAALRELFRVLRPGGMALVQVPVAGDGRRTDEDPELIDPDERLRRFGQHDHVRLYGLDLRERFADTGFRVAVESCRSLWSNEEIRRYSLLPAGSTDDFLFVGHKPA